VSTEVTQYIRRSEPVSRCSCRDGKEGVTTVAPFIEAAERRSRANPLIPQGSFQQNRWKGRVLIAISGGTPIRTAIDEATRTEQVENPTFGPQYDPALLDLT